MNKKFFISKEVLYDYYVIKKKSIKETADILHCSYSVIYRNMKFYNITRRNSGEAVKLKNITHNSNCQCCVCKRKRKEPHESYCTCLSCLNKKGISHPDNCKCCSCCAKRKEYVGSKNGFYNKSHNEAFKLLQSLKMKEILKNPTDNPFYNKSHSEETKKRISLAKGGTGIPYEKTEWGAEFDDNLKEQVRFRDSYKCRLCGCSQIENGRQLSVHHIDYNKMNCDVNNLISLCISCHMKTNNNRKYWVEMFDNLCQGWDMKLKIEYINGPNVRKE